jgi:hypothetical protein
MKFDQQGHILWTPKALYDLAKEDPRQLVTRYLMIGTPWAFEEYRCYCDFLEAVAERTGIHSKNLYLRGSCHTGFSIAPKQTAWTVMRGDPNPSDLDLVIVDEAYFTRFEREVQWWEDRNPGEFLQGKASEAFERRRQDRQFNCCRDEALPPAICIHHQDTMRRVSEMSHCGLRRKLSAFIYPDWLSARQRYEYDLRKLTEGVEAGRIAPPGDEPIPVKAVNGASTISTAPLKSEAPNESGASNDGNLSS